MNNTENTPQIKLDSIQEAIEDIRINKLKVKWMKYKREGYRF